MIWNKVIKKLKILIICFHFFRNIFIIEFMSNSVWKFVRFKIDNGFHHMI